MAKRFSLGTLVPMKENLNVTAYNHILDIMCLFPMKWQEFVFVFFLFQYDSVSVHKSSSIKKWFSHSDVEIMQTRDAVLNHIMCRLHSKWFDCLLDLGSCPLRCER